MTALTGVVNVLDYDPTVYGPFNPGTIDIRSSNNTDVRSLEWARCVTDTKMIH